MYTVYVYIYIIILYIIILFYFILYYIIVYYSILYFIILYYIILYYIILYYIVCVIMCVCLYDIIPLSSLVLLQRLPANSTRKSLGLSHTNSTRQDCSGLWLNRKDHNLSNYVSKICLN